jgi:HD-GYP domain-containing protein (c-di-GMP phosphodiesterase class II)
MFLDVQVIQQRTAKIQDFLDDPHFKQSIEPLLNAAPFEIALYGLGGTLLHEFGDRSDPSLFSEVLKFDSLECDKRSVPLIQTYSSTQTEGSGDSYRLVPMEITEGCVGILLIPARSLKSAWGSGLSNDEILTSIADILAKNVEDKKNETELVEELSNRFEELSFIFSLAGALRVSNTEREAVNIIFRLMEESLETDFIFLSLPENDYYRGYPTTKMRALDIRKLAETTRECVFDGQESTALNHVHDDVVSSKLPPIAVPFKHIALTVIDVDGVEGIIGLFRESSDKVFKMSDIKLLETVGQFVSVYLNNRAILKSREKLFDLTVFGLARLAESRDDDTGEHLGRVAYYCRILADEMKSNGSYDDVVDGEFVDTIFRMSPLHDIGKVGISDTILLKPGKLTEAEFEAMKAHTVIGGDAIVDIERRYGSDETTFISMGREIAYFHHEKWDGSGYPKGLANFEIPLCARIMAVADVYDALTSKRCYKDAFSHEKARGILIEDSGSHFDPIVVEAFIAREIEINAVRTANKQGFVELDVSRVLELSVI